MLRIIFILPFFIMGISGECQRPGIFHSEEMKTMEDAWGRPIRPQTTYKIEGSPFFPESYTTVRFHFKNGKTNSSVKARLNLYDNKINYLNTAGEEMELINPVYKLEFKDTAGNTLITLQNGFTYDLLDENIFYHVLDSGKIVLLKQYSVSYRDFSAYGTAVITRTFVKKIFYFIIKNGRAYKTGKHNEELLNLLNDKKIAIEDHIKENRIKTGSEPGLLSVIRYYNSL